MTHITDNPLQSPRVDPSYVVRVHTLEAMAHDAAGRIPILYVVGGRGERSAQRVESAALAFDPQPLLQLVKRLADRVVGVHVEDSAILIRLHVFLNPRVSVLRDEQELLGTGFGLGPAGQRLLDGDRGDRPERELAYLLSLRSDPIDEQVFGVHLVAVVRQVGDVTLTHARVERQQDECEQGATVSGGGRHQLAAFDCGEHGFAIGVLALANVAFDQLLRLLPQRLVFVQGDRDQLGRTEGPLQHLPNLRHAVVEAVDADARGQSTAKVINPTGLLFTATHGDGFKRRVVRNRIQEVMQAGAAVIVKFPVADLPVADAMFLDDHKPIHHFACGNLIGWRDQGCHGRNGFTPRFDLGGHDQVKLQGAFAARVIRPLAEEEESLSASDAFGLAPLAVAVGEEREVGAGLLRLDRQGGAVTITRNVRHAVATLGRTVRYPYGSVKIDFGCRQGVWFGRAGCRSGCRERKQHPNRDARKVSDAKTLALVAQLDRASVFGTTRRPPVPRLIPLKTRIASPPQAAGMPNRRRYGCRTTPTVRPSVQRAHLDASPLPAAPGKAVPLG